MREWAVSIAFTVFILCISIGLGHEQYQMEETKREAISAYSKCLQKTGKQEMCESILEKFGYSAEEVE